MSARLVGVWAEWVRAESSQTGAWRQHHHAERGGSKNAKDTHDRLRAEALIGKMVNILRTNRHLLASIR
jgi:hypothetical protein